MAGFRQNLRLVPNESFGAMLRARRFQNNQTQAQLAADLGTRQQTVGNWERGERPQKRFLGKLAEYVELDEGALRVMLDREAVARSSGEPVGLSPSRATDQHTSPDSAIQAFIAVAKSYSVKIALGNDLNPQELAQLDRVMDVLERHLAQDDRI